MFKGFPVCGFLPLRAARLTTLKVPKPINVTLSPFFNEPPIVFVTDSRAEEA